MNAGSTFYLSRVIGNNIYSIQKKPVGKLKDLVVDISYIRPKVIGVKAKIKGTVRIIDFSEISLSKNKGQYVLICKEERELEESPENRMLLARQVMDRQIVDMDGRKVVRVNDLRLAVLSNGVYVVAVDVGFEGLLRRLGAAKPLKRLLAVFGLNIPGKLILWDEVAAIDFYHTGIKLSKEYSKLYTLHPSDLADILEDLDRNTQFAIFTSLDEEKAADVLEELETEAQLNVLGSLSIEKAADVLEKMPADEVADILDEMQVERAEELLNEMESEASEEVRELMEYDDNTVGSVMTTEYISFNEDQTVDETILELRRLKPEPDSIYYLYVLDNRERLIATVSLRDIVISEPGTRLKEIMNQNVIAIHDDEEINTLAEIISKYSLLAIPVIDESLVMVGVVVIDDVVHRLIKAGRRRS